MKIRSFIKLCAKIYKTKAAKVALLGVCSTMLLVSSGVSFAKYYSENGFGDGASIAELGTGEVYYDYEMNQTPSYLDLTNPQVFAFIAQFRIEFSASEVARTFDLELRLSKTPNMDYKEYDPAEKTSFISESATPKTYPTFVTKITEGVGNAYKVNNSLDIEDEVLYETKEDNEVVEKSENISSDNDTNRKKWDDVRDSNIKNYEKDKIYFGYVANESEDIHTTIDSNDTIVVTGVDYTWSSIDYNELKDIRDEDVLSKTNIDLITSGKISDLYDCKLGLEAKTYYFSIIFFSTLEADSSEDTKILSKLTISQLNK